MRASNELEIRPILMNTVARIIAHEGLGRATTKNIALQSGVNENYIYRYFEDKDDLLKGTCKHDMITVPNIPACEFNTLMNSSMLFAAVQGSHRLCVPVFPLLQPEAQKYS